MSSEGQGAFDPLAGRKAPSRLDTKGATGRKGVIKPPPEKTKQISFRGTPELHVAIKRAALDHGLTMEQLITNAFHEYTGTAPEPEQVIVEKEAIKEEPEPRDANAGLNQPLGLWGDDTMQQALKMLADIENCTPSMLLKALLVYKVEQYHAQGKTTGISTGKNDKSKV